MTSVGTIQRRSVARRALDGFDRRGLAVEDFRAMRVSLLEKEAGLWPAPCKEANPFYPQ
ncbi:hypothetical protein AA102526_0232 [Asaia lannensis NBRC 102526]|nr:hypothetical protein AA102526_0232 [Asaia lannensis NBRC 102526]